MRRRPPTWWGPPEVRSRTRVDARSAPTFENCAFLSAPLLILVHMNDALYHLVASQHGLLTRAQALRAGLSPGQWSSITRSDEWAQMYPGVVRRRGAPETFELALMGGCLYADAVASHRAAGVLW